MVSPKSYVPSPTVLRGTSGKDSVSVCEKLNSGSFVPEHTGKRRQRGHGAGKGLVSSCSGGPGECSDVLVFSS